MNIPPLKEFKAEAKQLVISKGVKPTHAHEIIAKSYGFKTYNSYLYYLKGATHDKTT